MPIRRCRRHFSIHMRKYTLSKHRIPVLKRTICELYHTRSRVSIKFYRCFAILKEIVCVRACLILLEVILIVTWIALWGGDPCLGFRILMGALLGFDFLEEVVALAGAGNDLPAGG